MIPSVDEVMALSRPGSTDPNKPFFLAGRAPESPVRYGGSVWGARFVFLILFLAFRSPEGGG
jgi:hypothetical protein